MISMPCPNCGFKAETKDPQSIEYLARIEYEAQVKYADVPAMPWAELSLTHRDIAIAGIRAVLEKLEGRWYPWEGRWYPCA